MNDLCHQSSFLNGNRVINCDHCFSQGYLGDGFFNLLCPRLILEEG